MKDSIGKLYIIKKLYKIYLKTRGFEKLKIEKFIK